MFGVSATKEDAPPPWGAYHPSLRRCHSDAILTLRPGFVYPYNYVVFGWAYGGLPLRRGYGITTTCASNQGLDIDRQAAAAGLPEHIRQAVLALVRSTSDKEQAP